MLALLHVLFALLAVYASAQKENQTLTDDFSCEQAGAYTLCQNLWGRSSGSGSQRTTLISAMGQQVAWSTEYNWSGEANSVKSYANVEHQTAKGVQLSDLKSMPSVWNWYHETQSADLRADVAYDLWLGTSKMAYPASADSSYEIMIWLSQMGGVAPIGARIASNIPLGNSSWDLWSGPNSNWHVFSFVSTDGDVKNFEADLKDFLGYLIANNGVANSQYIQSLQAGTEPFTGSAVFITSAYSISVTRDDEEPSQSTTSSTSTRSVATSHVATTASSHVSTSTPSPPPPSPMPPPPATIRTFHHCALRRPSKLVARALPTSPAAWNARPRLTLLDGVLSLWR